MPAEEANMNTIFIARVKFQKHPSSGIIWFRLRYYLYVSQNITKNKPYSVIQFIQSTT
jgi:hypothetical protein